MASILLVDDDSSMRHFLSKALERAGHKITKCEDGIEALECIQSSSINAFDLLLTDVVMPKMDGIKLSQKVSEIDPNVKIMFMTGFSAVTLNRKDVPEDMNMMAKPFHLNDLIAQIDKILTN